MYLTSALCTQNQKKIIQASTFACTPSTSDPQRACVCSCWSWRSIVQFSPIALGLHMWMSKALSSHLISHKMCSLQSCRLLQWSALGKAEQAGSCLHANTLQSCDPKQGGPAGALPECHTSPLLPGAQRESRLHSHCHRPVGSFLYFRERVHTRWYSFPKLFLELFHKESSAGVTDTPSPPPSFPSISSPTMGKVRQGQRTNWCIPCYQHLPDYSAFIFPS